MKNKNVQFILSFTLIKSWNFAAPMFHKLAFNIKNDHVNILFIIQTNWRCQLPQKIIKISTVQFDSETI
jgi:hypothetical protein